MKRMLLKKYRKFIRPNEVQKANLVKHFYSIIGGILGAIWLSGWGVKLIFLNESMPFVKLATIGIGYLSFFTNFYFEQKKIERRKERHALKRKLRRMLDNA